MCKVDRWSIWSVYRLFNCSRTTNSTLNPRGVLAGMNYKTLLLKSLEEYLLKSTYTHHHHIKLLIYQYKNNEILTGSHSICGRGLGDMSLFSDEIWLFSHKCIQKHMLKKSKLTCIITSSIFNHHVVLQIHKTKIH